MSEPPTKNPLRESPAYAAGGFLVDLYSPRTVFLIGGIGVLVVLLPVLLVLRRERPDDQGV